MPQNKDYGEVTTEAEELKKAPKKKRLGFGEVTTEAEAKELEEKLQKEKERTRKAREVKIFKT